MSKETEVVIRCKLFSDFQDLVGYLVGDDFTFNYDPSKGIMLSASDLRDLFGRIRGFELKSTFTVEIEGQLYNEWWEPLIPIENPDNLTQDEMYLGAAEARKALVHLRNNKEDKG